MGKRDYYAGQPLPVPPFLRNLSFTLVDLRGLACDAPRALRRCSRRSMERFGRGDLRPVPTAVWPIGEVAAAFRTMAQAQHIGKLVVSLTGRGRDIHCSGEPRSALDDPADRLTSSPAGWAALGLTVAEWLVAQGARHLALLGRSAPTAAAAQAIEALRARGAQVLVLQADVAAPTNWRRPLARCGRRCRRCAA